VKRDRQLTTLLRDNTQKTKTSGSPSAAGRSGSGSIGTQKFAVGARAGVALNSYEAGDDYSAFADSLGSSTAFNVAAYGAYQFSSLFALQAELLFTADEGGIGAGEKSEVISYTSLMIPLLAKMTYRGSNFTLSALAGPCFNIPLGDAELTNDSGSYAETYDYEVTAPVTIMLGVNVGKPAGNGVVFADLRYAFDLGDTEIERNGYKLEAFKRSAILISLGYELAL
jgi:hypothetical protein